MQKVMKAIEHNGEKVLVEAYEKEQGKNYHAVIVDSIMIAIEKRNGQWIPTPNTIDVTLAQKIGDLLELHNLA